MTNTFLIIIILILLLVLFWGISNLLSVWGGAIYVFSGNQVLRAAFRLAKLKRGDNFYELGSGLGYGLTIASKEFEANATGIEISPFHHLISRLRTFKDKKIKLIKQNHYHVDLSHADVIYCYLLPKTLEKLRSKFLKELKSGSRVVSYAFKIPGLEPKQVEKIASTKLYLYIF